MVWLFKKPKKESDDDPPQADSRDCSKVPCTAKSATGAGGSSVDALQLIILLFEIFECVSN